MIEKLTKNHRFSFRLQKLSVYYKVLAILQIFCCGFSLTLGSAPLKTEIIQKLFAPNSETLISEATTDVIREFYIANDVKFDIIIYGESSKHIDDIVNKILIKLHGIHTITHVKHFANISNWDHQIGQSALILTKSVENLSKLYESTMKIIYPDENNRDEFIESVQLTNMEPQQLKFFLYCEEIHQFDLLQNIIQKYGEFIFNYPGDIRFYQFFILNDHKHVNLSASLLYSEDHCGSFKLQILNSFVKSSQKWIKELKNFYHYSNFHGCLLHFLTLYVFFDKDHYHMDKKDIEKFLDFISYENLIYDEPIYEIIDFIGKKANFTYHYSFFIQGDDVLKPYGSKNYEPDESKFINLLITPKDFNVRTYHAISSYVFTKMYYLISSNEYYSNYEKLTMPFDNTTWLLLHMTFGITFGVILVLYNCPKWFKEIVIGEGTKSPINNVIRIFFGISQLKLPKKNMSRILLALFLWFCLIFRTCYQSMMFEFMTSDMRKPLPQSIDDLIKMNYTIVSHNNIDFYLKKQIGNRKIPRIMLLQTISELIMLYNQTLFEETHAKYAFFVGSAFHTHLNFTFGRSLPVMNDEKIEIKESFIIPQNNILAQSVDEIIERLNPSGIILYLDRKHNTKFIEEVVDNRRILSLSDLEYGFVLWLISIFFSILVFLLEIVIIWLKIIFNETVRKSIGLFEFINILRVRMSNYNDRW